MIGAIAVGALPFDLLWIVLRTCAPRGVPAAVRRGAFDAPVRCACSTAALPATGPPEALTGAAEAVCLAIQKTLEAIHGGRRAAGGENYQKSAMPAKGLPWRQGIRMKDFTFSATFDGCRHGLSPA